MCDWIEIQITFKALCSECHKEILPGRAFWCNSEKSARHLSCNDSTSPGNNIHSLSNPIVERPKLNHGIPAYDNDIIELKCFICGSKTGCSQCEYLVACEQRLVSKYCICDQCIIKQQDPFNIYQECFIKKLKYLK